MYIDSLNLCRHKSVLFEDGKKYLGLWLTENSGRVKYLNAEWLFKASMALQLSLILIVNCHCVLSMSQHCFKPFPLTQERQTGL